MFLGANGRPYLFREPAGLVAFVRGGEPHDLADLPEWERVRAAAALDVTPQLLNRYELDLVVDVARAGADGWGDAERQLLLLAGEIARELASYTGRTVVQELLAPGSPLDALDDDLRRGGLFARRRLRRYPGEQIALGWRRVVRELEAAVQWPD